MATHKVAESALTGGEPGISGVPIRILTDNGTTARVRVEGSGIHVRPGQTHTVASDHIRLAGDYS
jgi:hypothetical protein